MDKPKSHSVPIDHFQFGQGFKVGFYGCNNTLVRVAYHHTAQGKAPQSFWVDCPVCGNHHSVSKPMWRNAHSVEEYLSAHLEFTPPSSTESHDG